MARRARCEAQRLDRNAFLQTCFVGDLGHGGPAGLRSFLVAYELDAAPTVPEGDRLAATITRDIDGDTVVARFDNGTKIDVRLIGVDTPEEYRPDTPVECGAPAAAASMRRLAEGRRAALITDPTQARFDRYGRLLAYLYVGGRNLDLVQVRRGWGHTYVYEDPFRQVGSFRRAEALARSESRGVWGRCGGDFHSAG